MRRYTYTPMRALPKRRPGSGTGSAFTTRSGSTRALATAHRSRPMQRNARGYVDDRLRRPAAPPPLPEQARNPGKCSPSPTSPHAQQSTEELIKKGFDGRVTRASRPWEPTSKSAGLRLNKRLRLSPDRGPPQTGVGTNCESFAIAKSRLFLTYDTFSR